MLTFRQYSRKGYALFACLGREVRIGVLSVATLSGAAPCLALQARHALVPADTLTAPDEENTGLDEALVTTSRAPLGANLSARPLVTLTRRDLAAAGVTSINDALKLAAPIDVRQRGGFGIQTDISINGGTFDQIVLLVDGIALTNPQTGHNAADFPINLSDIERIEILEGAAARVYGSQAFSGAVNIVTRRGTEDEAPLDLRLDGGSYGTWLAEGRTAFRLAPGWHSSLSASFRRSDGAVDNGDFRGGKLYWGTRFDTPALRLDAQVGATLQDFGANTFYSAAYPDQWEATRRYLVALRGETKGRIRLAATASWLRSTDHYQLVRNTPTGENHHRGDVYTLGLSALTSWIAGRTSVGAEMRQESILSTNLGHPLSEGEQRPVPGTGGTVLYSRHDARTHLNAHLEHSIALGPVSLSAGLMATRIADSPTESWQLCPGIDASYRPTATWRIYASWNRSMRQPTFTDLWYKSPTLEGNTALRAEKNASLRLGIAHTATAWQVGTTVYADRATRLIDWVMLTPDDVYRATAFDLDRLGAGLTARGDLTALLGPRQPLAALTLDYAYVYLHRRAGTPYFRSNYAMEPLRHKLVVTLRHRFLTGEPRLIATWTAQLRERRGGYAEYGADLRPTGRILPYGTLWLVDGRIAWNERLWSLYVEGTNLTARRYFDLGNVRQPGLLLMAGVSLRPFGGR